MGGRMDIRGVYRFSSLMNQNKKAKNYAVFCFAGKKKLLFYIYAVIVKQIFYKRSTNHYSGPLSPSPHANCFVSGPVVINTQPSFFHTISLSPVRVTDRLVHTGLGSSSLVTHVLHYPPPRFIIGTDVIKTHTSSK
jgi:hypothetical protein